MIGRTVRYLAACLALVSGCGLLASRAEAQAIMPIVPQTQLTPQQMQSIMMMRALQGRGRRGVQTGYPQMIPMGPQGVPGSDYLSGDEQPTTARKSSSQKRAEARQAQKDQKQAAIDKAKAKTKKAKAGKKAKGEDNPDDGK